MSITITIPPYLAWNKTTKEIEPVLLICFVNKYVDVLPERNLEGGSQESWKFEDIELLRHTGLIDKNKKRIYEGHIVNVQVYQVGDRSPHPRFENKVVEWIEKEGRWDLMNGVAVFQQGQYYEAEIVGNKYENPELITKKQLKNGSI